MLPVPARTMASTPALIQGAIGSRTLIAKDVCLLTLATPTGSICYQPGQYVRLTLPQMLYEDPRANSRDFSIASAPTDSNAFEIAFRMTGSGFKRTLLALPEHSSVVIEGPFGIFILPEQEDRPITCIAAGIGITPFRSMLQQVGKKKLPHTISLLYWNRSAENVPFKEELEALAQACPRVSVALRYGPLRAEDLAVHVKNQTSSLYYIAGPPGAVHIAAVALMQAGVKEADMQTESFTNYEY